MGHSSKDHNANLHFDADDVQFIRSMAWIWGTCAALRQQDMVESFRNNPTALRRLVQHHDTALSILYDKVREVEVHERC